VKTLKVDAYQRVRLPDVKPGQVVAYENRGNGAFTLTIVKAKPKEPFPPGSLAKYCTKERDDLISSLMAGLPMQEPE
jgi:hypothetical protein